MGSEVERGAKMLEVEAARKVVACVVEGALRRLRSATPVDEDAKMLEVEALSSTSSGAAITSEGEDSGSETARTETSSSALDEGSGDDAGAASGDTAPPPARGEGRVSPLAAAAAAAFGAAQGRLRRASTAIEDSNYPDELLEALNNREEQALRLAADGAGGDGGLRGGGGGLPQAVRGAVVYIATRVAEVLRLPPEQAEEIVVMTDVYCQRCVRFPDLDQVPSTTVAICNVVFKASTSVNLADTHVLLSAADWFAAWLHEAGFVSLRTFSKRDLLVQEVLVLQALEWHTQVPTTYSRLTALCARLDAATQGVFKASIDWILEQGLSRTRTALQYISAFDAPPSRLAAGVLCHGLVAKGLLHVDMVCPRKSADEWEQLFANGTLDTEDEHEFPANLQACTFELLQLAADASVESLQQDSLLVARVATHCALVEAPPPAL